MGVNLSSLLNVGTGAAGAYQQATANRPTQEMQSILQSIQAEQQRKKDALTEALQKANLGHIQAQTQATLNPPLRPTAPRPPAAPVTRNTTRGIEQWNPDTKKWELQMGDDNKPMMPFVAPRAVPGAADAPYKKLTAHQGLVTDAEKEAAGVQSQMNRIQAMAKARGWDDPESDVTGTVAPGGVLAGGATSGFHPLQPGEAAMRASYKALKGQQQTVQKKVEALRQAHEQMTQGVLGGSAAPTPAAPAKPKANDTIDLTADPDKQAAWAAKHPPKAGESYEQYQARYKATGG